MRSSLCSWSSSQLLVTALTAVQLSVRMSSSHWLVVLLPMEYHLTYLPAYLKLLIIVTFERISRRTSGDMISTEVDMGGRSLADFHWIQDS